MARTRGLLTENDQTVLENEETGQTRYNARSAIRRRIVDELPTDVSILKNHEPNLWSRMMDVVFQASTESITTPRITQTASTNPDHVLTHFPVPETGQTALVQRTPADVDFGTISEVIDTLSETYLFEPNAGWFTIAQNTGAIQGNGADGFLHALHTPHSTISPDPDRKGSVLFYVRSNHPDISFLTVSGQVKANVTELQNLQISVIGPEDDMEIHDEVSDLGDFEESTFEVAYFGGDTSTYHDLGDRLLLEPIEVIKQHRITDLASHPYEILCSNPYYHNEEDWLEFLPTERESRSHDFLTQLATQLASADRIRCFSTSDTADSTLRAEDITVQHISGYSTSFDTTNLYLPVTPV